ncbi:DUF6705 family protein [Chryseobacterium sp. CFS15]|uniref:DUF6705 family protein n=1 Tax=Chryseobacterium sp. CFS15 TaxID=2986946 RepID=UPI0028077B29|nr:DUF6705 family protein [Chryseobacterium sp. CFS15]MDQ8143812.1 hypothetical protein [Chryseobacterium sp. CFS15]
MKILLYKKIFFSFVLIGIISCKAQQNPLPLNTWMENIPQGAYVKDLNNELSPYVGTYKATYQGNEITLFITKEENKLEELTNKYYYNDVLNVKYKIKNSSGQILQETQNGTTPNNIITSTRTKPSTGQIILYYEGTNCGVGWGDIYLKKINNTQISWTYNAESTLITEQNCPGNPDKTVYLPQTKDLIFTKQ